MKPRFATLLALLKCTDARADSDDAALEVVISALKTHLDEEEAAVEEMEEEKSGLQKALDTANASLKAVQDELAKLKGDTDAAAEKADRAEMEALATSLAVKLDAATHKTAKDVRRAIAMARTPTLRADAADATVEAIVEIAKTEVGQRADGRDHGSKVWTTVQDGTTKPNEQPRRRVRHPWGHNSATGARE